MEVIDQYRLGELFINIDNAIVGFDRCLFDTEMIHYYSYKFLIKDKFNEVITISDYHDVRGKDRYTILDYLLKSKNIKTNESLIDELVLQHKEYLFQMSCNLIAYPMDWFNKNRKLPVNSYIVSLANDRECIENILKLSNIIDMFNSIVVCEKADEKIEYIKRLSDKIDVNRSIVIDDNDDCLKISKEIGYLTVGIMADPTSEFFYPHYVVKQKNKLNK